MEDDGKCLIDSFDDIFTIMCKQETSANPHLDNSYNNNLSAICTVPYLDYLPPLPRTCTQPEGRSSGEREGVHGSGESASTASLNMRSSTPVGTIDDRVIRPEKSHL